MPHYPGIPHSAYHTIPSEAASQMVELKSNEFDEAEGIAVKIMGFREKQNCVRNLVLLCASLERSDSLAESHLRHL